MGWRLFRRKQLIPGVRLNISRSGPSIRLGPRGAGITVGGRSGLRATAGLPGSGIYYTTTAHHRRTRRAVPASRTYTAPAAGGSSAVGCLWVTGVLIGVGLAVATHGLILIPVAIAAGGWIWWHFTRPEVKAAKVIAHAQTLPGDQAVIELHEAIALDPNGAKTLTACGDWFAENKCWEDAAECFGGALHAKADWGLEAKYTEALVMGGRIDEAIPRLEQHRQLSWLTVESRASMSSALAAAYLAKGDPSQALALVSEEPLRKHELDSGLQQCLYMRAASQYLLGQRAKAIGDIDRLYAINSGYSGLAEAKAEMTAGNFTFGLGKPYPDWYPHTAIPALSSEPELSELGPTSTADSTALEATAAAAPASAQAEVAVPPAPPVLAPSSQLAGSATSRGPESGPDQPQTPWLSPDGKWRWEGSAWVPTEQPHNE
jgi:tetratricopeptide (TPR) repeat protein